MVLESRITLYFTLLYLSVRHEPVCEDEGPLHVKLTGRAGGQFRLRLPAAHWALQFTSHAPI